MEQATVNRELRVLMLEDTPTDAELEEHELRKAGLVFVSQRVETRDAFTRALVEFRPDIVLSDYKLPDFNGMAALEMMQRDHPDIPVVMVTGALSDIEAVELIHAGARDYVLKDRLARLAPAVQRALAAEQSARARLAAEEDLRRLNRTLRALSAGNRALIHGRDEMSLLEEMCRAVTDAGYVLAWVGYVQQDEQKTIRPMAVSGKGRDLVDELQLTWDDQPLGRGPTGMAVRTGQTQIIRDIAGDPRMEPWRERAGQFGFASSIALPLKENGTVIGTLTIYAAEADGFGADQVALLEEMAGDLAFGIVSLRTRNERDQAYKDRQQYADRLRASLEEALQAISATVEMRDPYTSGHQRRMAELAVAIARLQGLPEEQVHGIRLAGIVHDLGKIRVPAEILSKPTVLTDIEFNLIKIHPQLGYDILKEIEFPWPIAQAVLQHHERLDGSGYPQGLKAEQILPEAKILAVADVVEAMSSHRPYRASLGLEAALDEISKGRGVIYDPAAVDSCLTLFREKNFTFTD